MADDLNLHRLVTEPRQDDSVEHVSLQEGTSPIDVSALVVERFRFDLVHGLGLLLISPSDGTLAVGVVEHLEVAAAGSPVRPHLVEYLRDRLAFFGKVDHLQDVPFEIQVQGADEVAAVQGQVHLHPGRWVLDNSFFFKHVEQSRDPSQLRPAFRAGVPALSPLPDRRDADTDYLRNVGPAHTAFTSEVFEQAGDGLLSLLEDTVSQITFTCLTVPLLHLPTEHVYFGAQVVSPERQRAS